MCQRSDKGRKLQLQVKGRANNREWQIYKSFIVRNQQSCSTPQSETLTNVCSPNNPFIFIHQQRNNNVVLREITSRVFFFTNAGLNNPWKVVFCPIFNTDERQNRWELTGTSIAWLKLLSHFFSKSNQRLLYLIFLSSVNTTRHRPWLLVSFVTLWAKYDFSASVRRPDQSKGNNVFDFCPHLQS